MCDHQIIYRISKHRVQKRVQTLSVRLVLFMMCGHYEIILIKARALCIIRWPRRDIAANKINAVNKIEFTANTVECIHHTANKSQQHTANKNYTCTLQTKNSFTLQTKNSSTLQTKNTCTLQTKNINAAHVHVMSNELLCH